VSSRSSVVAYIAKSVYFATLRSPRSTAIATSEHIRFLLFLVSLSFFPPYYFFWFPVIGLEFAFKLHLVSCRIVNISQRFSFNFVLQRFYSAANRRARSIPMSVSVCVCVFVCPRSHLRNYTSDLHQVFFAHVNSGRGSVLLWRRSDTLPISGFVYDVVFAHELTGFQTSPPV